VSVRAPTSLLVLLAGGFVVPLPGQSVNAGVTAGFAHFNAAQSEQTLTGIIQVHPRSWLSLSAIPSLVRVSDSSTGRTTHSGLGDLPLAVAADHTFPGAWSPVIGAALIATLPTGNAACGLGSGETGVGVDGGLAVAPGDRWQLSASASRSVGGSGFQSVLSAPHATALRLEGAYGISDHWTASAAFGADVGSSDSTAALSRVIGAGAGYRIAGDVALTLDATRGLTNASPQWVLAIGLGTVFAGASPVNPTSPLRRLRTGFVGGVKRTRTATRTGTATC
jgi:hypothetical protein